MNDFNPAVLNSYDEIDIISARLSEHMNNKFFFNSAPFAVNHNVKVFESYATRNLRQSFFYECTFENANFNKSGLAGSVFVGSKIYPCDFMDTNLQSCDFRLCTFENVVFEYTRMNKSCFYNTKFINCTFKSVSMNDTIFDHCEFIKCDWIPVSIENALFRNTLLSDVKFKSMNFEFATFENIETKNIKLPFPTIPFIYNGLSYITETTDNVKITSAIVKEGLTTEQYLSYLDDLEKFYHKTQNYFPLANIYISKKKYEEAFQSIVNGIDLAISLRSFRMIRYYCKQTKYIPTISIHQRQELYYNILTKISKEKLEYFEKDNLNLYLPQIRSLLLTENTEERIQVFAKTNIHSIDYKNLTIFISVIDSFLRNKCHYSIELRHNSPFEVFVDIFTNPDNLSLIISGLSLIVGVGQLIQGKKEKNKPTTMEDDIKNHIDTLNKNKIIIEKFIINNNGNVYINSNNKSISKK